LLKPIGEVEDRVGGGSRRGSHAQVEARAGETRRGRTSKRVG